MQNELVIRAIYSEDRHITVLGKFYIVISLFLSLVSVIIYHSIVVVSMSLVLFIIFEWYLFFKTDVKITTDSYILQVNDAVFMRSRLCEPYRVGNMVYIQDKIFPSKKIELLIDDCNLSELDEYFYKVLGVHIYGLGGF